MSWCVAPRRASSKVLYQRPHIISDSFTRCFTNSHYSSSSASSDINTPSKSSTDDRISTAPATSGVTRVTGPRTDSVRLARWQQTPPRLSLPFKLRRGSMVNIKCNDDPKKLDNMYFKLFGAEQGEEGRIGTLSEETKWLAVTHKSFDQGRRGFNERLSLIGRRIVEAETSMALAANASSTPTSTAPDKHGRVPYEHPQLRGIETLAEKPVDTVLTKWAMFGLASKYGIPAIVRWRPKNEYDPNKSGLDTVATQCLYAIVGAVALERGGYEAKTLVREKILKPLKVLEI